MRKEWAFVLAAVLFAISNVSEADEVFEPLFFGSAIHQENGAFRVNLIVRQWESTKLFNITVELLVPKQYRSTKLLVLEGKELREFLSSQDRAKLKSDGAWKVMDGRIYLVYDSALDSVIPKEDDPVGIIQGQKRVIIVSPIAAGKLRFKIKDKFIAVEFPDEEEEKENKKNQLPQLPRLLPPSLVTQSNGPRS
ncbi:MAG TPA: hypothetical protein VEK36_01495 [Candidatus Paceibacterota bacterium]|nr:hypothetical protein [Candidatus Paceibacterota bacterium]